MRSYLLQTMLLITLVSTSPVIPGKKAEVEFATDFSATGSSDLAATLASVNDTTSIAAEEEATNVTESSSESISSEAFPTLENSARLERNVASLGALNIINESTDKNASASEAEENSSTAISMLTKNAISSMNTSEVRAFNDDHHDDRTDEEVTESEPHSSQPSADTTITSTVAVSAITDAQATSGARGEANSGAIYEKTDGVQQTCQSHADCYELREPMAWCDLKLDASWTDEGCFCDRVTGSCIIELRKNGQLFYTDCLPRSQFRCL